MIEKELKEETEKWLEKIVKVKITPASEKGKWMKENIEAYISDCRHFLEENDLVRAFECVIWAWAFLEIGKELGELE